MNAILTIFQWFSWYMYIILYISNYLPSRSELLVFSSMLLIDETEVSEQLEKFDGTVGLEDNSLMTAFAASSAASFAAYCAACCAAISAAYCAAFSAACCAAFSAANLAVVSAACWAACWAAFVTNSCTAL